MERPTRGVVEVLFKEHTSIAEALRTVKESTNSWRDGDKVITPNVVMSDKRGKDWLTITNIEPGKEEKVIMALGSSRFVVYRADYNYVEKPLSPEEDYDRVVTYSMVGAECIPDGRVRKRRQN